MRYHELIENVDLDYGSARLADKLRSDVMKYFMNEENSPEFWGGRIENMGGRKFVTFPGSLFGWPHVYSNSVLALEGTDNPWSPGGFYTKLRSGRNMVGLKIVEDPERDLDEAIRNIVHNRRVHEVLVHEIIHFMDDIKRRKNRSQKGEEKYNAAKLHHEADYYNEASEVNAYFHNFADKLIPFMRMAENSDPKQILAFAKGSKISKDFWQTWESTLGDGYQPALTKFRELMRKHTRRRVLSRFYQLHQKVVAILEKAERDLIA